jgi:hypothetical protein
MPGNPEIIGRGCQWNDFGAGSGWQQLNTSTPNLIAVVR